MWFFQICLKNSELKTTHNTFRYCSRALFPTTFLEMAAYKILTWLRWKVKIAIFSLLHCLAIPRRDLSSKKAKPNIKKWQRLGLWENFNISNAGYYFSLTKTCIKKCGARAELMFYLLIQTYGVCYRLRDIFFLSLGSSSPVGGKRRKKLSRKASLALALPVFPAFFPPLESLVPGYRDI